MRGNNLGVLTRIQEDNLLRDLLESSASSYDYDSEPGLILDSNFRRLSKEEIKKLIDPPKTF
jgi:hypothetical protein